MDPSTELNYYLMHVCIYTLDLLAMIFHFNLLLSDYHLKKVQMCHQRMSLLNQYKVTNSAARTGNCRAIKSNSTPAFGHAHIIICNKWPTDLRFRRSCDNIASKLEVAFRLYIPPMILIKVANFIHKIDRCSHILLHIDRNITNTTNIALIFSQRIIVLHIFFPNSIHNNKQSNRKSNKNNSHDNIENNSFLECCLTQFTVDKKQINELISNGLI